MGLRCKKGDMAWYLRAESERRYGSVCDIDEWRGFGVVDGVEYSDLWDISFSGEGVEDGLKLVGRDCNLLPIRPNELKEEEEMEVTA